MLEQGATPDSHRCGEGGETSEPLYVCSDERTVVRLTVLRQTKVRAR